MHCPFSTLSGTLDLKFQSRIVVSIDAETNNDSDGIDRNDVIVSVCPTSRFSAYISATSQPIIISPFTSPA